MLAAPPEAPAAAPAPAHVKLRHALVIGNNRYPHLPRLETAIADAEGVAGVLAQKYGFEVTLLRDAGCEQSCGEHEHRAATGPHQLFSTSGAESP